MRLTDTQRTIIREEMQRHFGAGARAAGGLVGRDRRPRLTCGTLKANSLVALEHICDISSYLVVNQASLKLTREFKRGLIQQ